jgi:hypothetical protein
MHAQYGAGRRRAQRHPVRFKFSNELSKTHFDLRVTWKSPPAMKVTVQVGFANDAATVPAPFVR